MIWTAATPVFAIFNLQRADFGLLVLIAAILVYGCAGAPTPEAFGWPEFTVGALLMAAVGLAGAMQLFRPRGREPWLPAAQALALYGLMVPVTVGFAAGAEPALMLRDIIPFLFLLLPLFLTQAVARARRHPRVLTGVIAVSGILFAARVVLPLLVADTFWHPPGPADPGYLANAATVLFAGLLLTGLAGRELYRGIGPGRVLRAATLAAAAFLPLAACMLVTQRASAGIVIAYGALMLGGALVRAPARAMVPLLAAALVLLLGAGTALHVAQTLLVKNQAVGVNMRWQEAAAVLRRLDTPGRVLFGRGWGATVQSPAVGGLTVNFTHSFVTTYWLKTGLCGLSLALLYLAQLARGLLPIARRRPLLAGAIAGPLLIDVTLYASFKSLDFGLLLLLIALWAPELQETVISSIFSPQSHEGHKEHEALKNPSL